MQQRSSGRRNFIKSSALISSSIIGLNAIPAFASPAPPAGLFMIGPMEGYSPHIGTIVSMLRYNRQTIIDAVKNLSVEQLDYLHDSKSNTIAALLMHLGAVDKYYQINTFEGRQEFNDAEKKIWDAGMNLGDAGRTSIKGKEVGYYLDLIGEVREKTLAEFKKKDDKWLLAVDPEWSKETPLNTYWKWFHVCEHESNHRGQISWLKGRMPGAKAGGE